MFIRVCNINLFVCEFYDVFIYYIFEIFFGYDFYVSIVYFFE